MPQERSNLATYGNRDIKSLVEHFRSDYLTEEEETSIISMWPALRTRLVRQKAITQIMYSVALTSLPQDLTTSRPAYFYWTSCSPQLHQQQSVSQVSLQWTTQNTLSDLMQMCSSDHAMKAYRPNSAITNWFSGAQTNRHILIFKLTTSNSKLSAHLLMMFIPGTSYMLGVQTRNWNTSYSSQFNCFILITLGKLLKALSNINWQCFVSQD